MTKPTIAALEDKITKLEERLDIALKALAEESIRAHARIDHASDVFNALRRATVSALKVEPTPPKVPRLPKAAFDRALADLRSDAGNDRALFGLHLIRERAAALEALEAQRASAAE